MKSLITALLTIISTAAGAQQVRIIVDAISRKPVPYATVKVVHSPAGKVASAEGHFAVDFSAADTLSITSVGYYDALLLGRDVTDTIALRPNPRLLQNVTVRSHVAGATFLIGNGKAVIRKKLKCRFNKDIDKSSCLPWDVFKAEFAEPMLLPDPVRTFQLNKLYIPIRTWDCSEPFFVLVYEADSATGAPGTAIFKKYIQIEKEPTLKQKLVLDLRDEAIYLHGGQPFFVSVSWTAEHPDRNCGTMTYLYKSATGICYSRNFTSPDYKWFLFDGNGAHQKLIPGHFHTMFAAEVEAVRNIR